MSAPLRGREVGAAFPWRPGAKAAAWEGGASAGAVAAALKHTLPEERRELTHVPLGELEAVGPQRGGGGGQHHLEQVPQVALEGQQTAQG